MYRSNEYLSIEIFAYQKQIIKCKLTWGLESMENRGRNTFIVTTCPVLLELDLLEPCPELCMCMHLCVYICMFVYNQNSYAMVNFSKPQSCCFILCHRVRSIMFEEELFLGNTLAYLVEEVNVLSDGLEQQ